MDGFESNDGVILIASTNRPDVLDPALLRPGRFDRRVVVSRPDVRGREGILKVHTRKIPLGEDVDIMVIARGTPGFSGDGGAAQLAQLHVAFIRHVGPYESVADILWHRLADWASRDRDNGLPQLWLAERARKRGDRDAMVAYIAQAARAPRFDDYYAPGIVLFWEYFKTAPITVEPAARAEAALNYGRTVPFGWTEATVRTCLDPTERTDALRAACLDLGSSMLERGSSLLARRNGTFLIERNAADPAVRQKATAARAGLDLDNGRCDPGFEITPGLESADPAVRARAIASADAWVRAIGASGEAAACARRLAASR